MFFPDGIKCIFCDGEIAEENRYCVCGNCSPAFNVNYCALCGKAIGNSADYCHDCKEGKRYEFSLARAPFEYTGEVKSAVYSLKYGNGRFLAKYMAEYLTDAYYESEMNADIITFVPMNEKRLLERGYNQAELLARCLSEIIKVPCVDLLKRTAFTTNLAKMNREQRAEAIKNTVEFNNSMSIKDKKILLVDDVMTTSATSNECARALNKAKPSTVEVLTFATSRVKPFLY